MSDIGLMMAMAGVVLLVFGGISVLSNNYTLNGIKARTVGNGQHGTARWATPKEIHQTYTHIPFAVRDWRRGENRPARQGLVLGSTGKKRITALVDSDDIHCLMNEF